MKTPDFCHLKTERDGLYDQLWFAIGRHVGYGGDCDRLTDEVLRTLLDYFPRPGQRPVHPQWDACLTTIRREMGE
jgi:hypothetical protein